MASIGNDLATIRKRQHLSLEDVHDTTKIPMRILESIENDSIFTDLEENATYIRSYIRSYAKALKIDDESIVKALDQHEAGTYSGILLEEESGTGEGKPKFTYDEDDDGPESAEEKEDMVHDHAPSVDDKKTPEIPKATTGAAPHSQSQPNEKVPPPPTVNSIDWADLGHKFTPLQTKSRLWIGIVFIVIIVSVVVFFLLLQNYPSMFGEGGTNSPVSQNITPPSVIPDSLQMDLTDPQEDTSNAIPTEVNESLPDTLTLLVYAAYDKLEPVRVYTDVMDDLNPYWIEKGEAYRFEFVNLLRLRGQYSRMELLMNGHLIENFRQRFYDPDLRMVVIERNLFENSDKWLTPPDTAELPVSPPTTVLNRPVFN